ncbi:MAG: hypothetical protein JNK05_38490 [Myxococcales bacterium]|nr:hypothetical protein [Myxococcales bacterium]
MSRAWIRTSPTLETTFDIYYHPSCAVDVDPCAMARLFAFESGYPNDEWRAATAADRAELALVEQLAKKRADAADRLEKDRARAAAGKKVEPWTIEPATDRRGRPRVRVRFAGNASAADAFGPLFEKCIPDWTLSAPKREYVLVPISRAWNRSYDDPSQPVVAALFGTRSDVKIVGAQREKVRAWKDEGLPTPLLWITDADPKNPRAADAKVLELREMLAAAGYEADDAQVLCTPANKASAFVALAAALDELLDRGAKVEDRSGETPVQRGISLLERAIAEGRTEAWQSALTRASALLDGASDRERATIGALAARCVGEASARDEAASILCAIERKTRAMHDGCSALLRAWTQDPTVKKLPDRLDSVCEALGRPIADEGSKTDLAWLAALEDAVVRSASATKRREVLAALLERAADAPSAARLAEKAATVTSSASRAWIATCAARISAKLARTTSGAKSERKGSNAKPSSKRSTKAPTKKR